MFQLPIGEATLLSNGSFSGKLSTLTIQEPITLSPSTENTETEKDFLIKCKGRTIGFAWLNRKAKTKGLITLRFAMPEFGEKVLRANLEKRPQDLGLSEFDIVWYPTY